MFDFQSTRFFESLFARNKVIDSRFVEEKIKRGDLLPSDLQKKWKYIQKKFN